MARCPGRDSIAANAASLVGRRATRSAPARPTACTRVRRGASAGALEPDQAAPLEAAQRRVRAARCARARRGRAQRRAAQAPRAPRAASRPCRTPSAQGRLARRRDRGPQRPLRPQRPAGARAGARRQHQRQPARRRGHVLARHPQPQRDQRLRDVGLQRRDRLGQPLRRQLALGGDVHHHAQQPPAPERDHQHAADPHVLQGTRQAVVERPAQAARGRQRLDLGDHTREATGRLGRRGVVGYGRHMPEPQVAVVGAGPAGVAAAVALKDRRLRPLLIDQADEVASVWRARYDRLRLNTSRPFSHLPGPPLREGHSHVPVARPARGASRPPRPRGRDRPPARNERRPDRALERRLGAQHLRRRGARPPGGRRHRVRVGAGSCPTGPGAICSRAS